MGLKLDVVCFATTQLIILNYTYIVISGELSEVSATRLK